MSEKKSNFGKIALATSIGVAIVIGSASYLKYSADRQDNQVMSKLANTTEFSDVSSFQKADVGRGFVIKTDTNKIFYAIYDQGLTGASNIRIIAGDGYILNDGSLIPYITEKNGNKYTLPNYQGGYGEEMKRLKEEYEEKVEQKDSQLESLILEKDELIELRKNSDNARKELEEKVSRLLDKMEGSGKISNPLNSADRADNAPQASQNDDGGTNIADNTIAGASSNSGASDIFANVNNGEIRTSQDRMLQKIPEEQRDKIQKEIVDRANEEYRKKKLQELSEKLAPLAINFPAYTKEVNGVITVFTDPTCPYCQRLHRDLEKIRTKGYDVNYLPIPKDGMNSPVVGQIAQAICAPKEQQPTAINNVFDNPHFYDTSGIANNDILKSCVGRIEKHYNLALNIDAQKTPFAFSDLGKVSQGYSGVDSFLDNLGFNEE